MYMLLVFSLLVKEGPDPWSAGAGGQAPEAPTQKDVACAFKLSVFILLLLKQVVPMSPRHAL